MATTILLKDLAAELGMDKSHARRYVLEQEDIEFLRVRTPETRGQQTLALTEEDAALVKERRKAEGFGSQEPTASSGYGWFYIIQLVPDLKPERVKLGFAKNAENRLRDHRTAAPTAELLETWPCKRSWEGAAIDCITREDCEPLSAEAFDCQDVGELIGRAEAFFQLMPACS